MARAPSEGHATSHDPWIIHHTRVGGFVCGCVLLCVCTRVHVPLTSHDRWITRVWFCVCVCPVCVPGYTHHSRVMTRGVGVRGTQ